MDELDSRNWIFSGFVESRYRELENELSSETSTDPQQLLEQRAWSGDDGALAELFSMVRPRLRRIIDARLDHRLKGRVDPSDVLQEAYIELARKMPELRKSRHLEETPLSMFVLMRLIATERVIVSHRRHMDAQGRDVRRETQQNQAAASSVFLAEHLLAVFGSAENRLLKQEMFDVLQNTLDSMDEVDHDIITMRCFEELTNAEAAEVLEISQNGASSRFVRAMTRLKKQLEAIPGFQ